MDVPADQERGEFSERLIRALDSGGYPTSPAAFASEFNLRADGARVSVYAVRKWLRGEAIPTQDKVHILARWIGVSAQWLRFGESGGAAGDASAFETRDLQLINDIRLLNEEQRDIILLLVSFFLRALPNECHTSRAS
jgi:transcriptional regulator with XRE-family HTH domain